MDRRQRRTAVAVALSALLALPAVAGADATSGSVTVGISVGVRSVSLSTASLTCAPALTFPSGYCETGDLTVTAGSAGGHMYINGGDAFASNGQAPNWALCDAACTGKAGNPGIDQFEETWFFQGHGEALSNDQQLDLAFNGTGVATANQALTSTLRMTGPESSTNPSTSWSTSVTWTAAP